MERQNSFQSEYLKKYIQLFVEGNQSKASAYAEMLHLVQQFREVCKNIKLVINKAGYEIISEKHQLDSLSGAIMLCYSKNITVWDEKSGKIAHDLKQVVSNINRIVSRTESRPDRSDLEENMKSINCDIQKVQEFQDLLLSRYREASDVFLSELKEKTETDILSG